MPAVFSFPGLSIEARPAGATGLIAAYLRRLGLVEMVNRMVRWDEEQWKVSPGQLVMALLINVLDSHRPLYRVEKYFAERDTEALLGKGVQAEHLHDDALGRALDRLAEAGAPQLLTQMAARAMAKGDVKVTTLHADTTSWSVAGAYEGEGDLNITYGYSKDQRPDLKQLMFGVAVQQEGLPLWGSVGDGNLSDKTWNHKAIEAVSSFLGPEGRREVVYVADSACVTRQNLDRLQSLGLRFTSRLPATFGLAPELIQEAWTNGEWREVGTLTERSGAASYRVQSFTRTLYGRPYRFVVVRSSQVDQRKQRKVERELAEVRGILEQAAQDLEHQSFVCLPDAELALKRFAAKWEGAAHTWKSRIEEQVTVKRRREWPRQGEEPPKEVSYRVSLQVGELRPGAKEERLAQESGFVLVTNILDETEYPAERVLREYKEQSTVEVRFRFLKDPMFVNALYLKKKERVEALGYVMLVALLLYTLIERAVRSGLAARKTYLPGPGGTKQWRPTARTIFQMLSSLQIARYIREGRQAERSLTALNKEQRLLLELTGVKPEEYVEVTEAS
jgi:transposase